MVFDTGVVRGNEEEEMTIATRPCTPSRYESLIPYFFIRR